MEVQELHQNARRFAEEYLIDFKVGKAAKRAGISRTHAADLLRDPRVDALIKDGKRKSSERVNVSVDMVLDILRATATTTAVDAKFLMSRNEDGFPFLDLGKLTPDERKAVKGVKWTKEGPQIEFYSKIDAAKLIGQFFGMFKEGIELSSPGGGPLRMIDETMNPKDAAEAYRLMIEGQK